MCLSRKKKERGGLIRDLIIENSNLIDKITPGQFVQTPTVGINTKQIIKNNNARLLGLAGAIAVFKINQPWL